MKNVVVSWKTSLVGIAIIAAGIYSVFEMESVTWTHALIPLGVGILLMIAPDSLITTLKKILSAKA